MAYHVIDRFEGTTAVIVADDGRTFDVPRSELPRGCREGAVLRLDGEPPDWSRAVIDEAERARRLQRAREALERLKESDHGGDVTL
jgi:hypothetical protein